MRYLVSDYCVSFSLPVPIDIVMKDCVILITIEISSRYPYLKTPELADAKRGELKRRLKRETEEIVCHFAGLVGRTMFALKNKGVSIDELIAIIEHSYARNGNKLIDQLEEVTIISQAIRVLHHF